MAEVIVNHVLRKLTYAVIQEALSLYGVRDKVKRVQRDLTWIQSFLKDADKQRHKNNRVKILVNEVQEVGYMIEDVLDKFLEEVGGGRTEGLSNKLKSIGKMPMKLLAKHRICSEIDYIHQRLCEIKENKEMYGIEDLEKTSVEQPIRPSSVHPDIDEMEVVGFEADRKTIVDQLFDVNITRRSVISIVGAGGSGKSTLAKDIYKRADVKRHFGISMWLTISKEYKLIDILIEMVVKIRKIPDSERQNKGEDYFITELNKSMREKKYLVVLDDVWSSDVWTQLEATLPDVNDGSRVLITTRFIEIPKMADNKSKPHEIQHLNEKDSKQLLLKKVFPNQFANECPNNLLPLITQFTEKCGGWPLPLVLLGGILSRKNPDYIKWDKVMQNMDWQTMGSGVISTSYEDLPVALKPCFMYFGVFPEDYQIKATTLIQLWIAEGFIPHDGAKLLEDIAESYLEELVQRCMVQVSRRSCIGKIKYCHTHDLLRDLAIQKAKEDNFLTVVTNKLSCNTCARRVALHGCGDKVIEHACKENIRSLINFQDVPNFNRLGMLRVLHLSTVPKINLYETNCLKGLNTLMTLKYFGLEGIYSDFPCCYRSRFFRIFPLTNMKNLQTVSTWFCKRYGKLPSSFWSNKQLRHINLICCGTCDATPEGPPSAADLQSLLTLKGVRARQDWVAELPKFPYLRKLGIVIPEDVAHEPLINLLSNLNYLGSMHLEMTKNNRMAFPDCISAFRNHNRLHSLSLVWGKWTRREDGDCTLFPPHLVKLIFQCFDFEVDPMPQLEKLPNLMVLKLCYSSFRVAVENRRMVCSRGGFGCLQLLKLDVSDLEEWKIEKGAMPILNQLQLESSLRIAPDLQNLVNLQVLTVKESFINDTWLKGEDQWKIKHIPSVNMEPPACNIM